ncbi:VPS4 [Enterospora canceri]|uniref:VPS4 n=1 Tax=Enterospora canceri TaxID=1081671 RepID=A0A1Y1S3N6_9MICR|nr:VPS4 [Enterospora canceri]
MSKYVLGQVTDEEKRLCDNADGVVRLYVIKPSDIKDKWVGNSEKNVKRLFGHLRSDLKPYHVNIAFFDEGEALFGSRKNMRKEDTTGAGIMQEFLTQISAISEDFQASFIFAATNMKEMIDPAIFRRFSNKIYFKNPDSIIRKKYIEHFIKKYNASDADITRLTQVTHNRSFSFIESLLTKFKNYDADGNFLKFNTAGAEQYIRGVEDMEKEEFRR